MVYFSDIFGIDEQILEEYGAFNISLVNDLPLFIDPFLLYASKKREYQKLHSEILKYLSFLKGKSEQKCFNVAQVRMWYCFPEVKQNWLGYSLHGNSGSGLGVKFGINMSKAMPLVYSDLNNETITYSSHLEKIGLFNEGVGRDNISDFTCNLIKGFLLKYTQKFAELYLAKENTKKVMVDKVYFDFDKESWMSGMFNLPFWNGDYVLLTPKDILTKDENWINHKDLFDSFLTIKNSVPNDELRYKINDLYIRNLPRAPKENDIKNAIQIVINQYPEILNYYIKHKEENKEGAKNISQQKVTDVQNLFVKQVQELISILSAYTDFYKISPTDSFEATRKRVLFLKDIIENHDGYRLFYVKGKPVERESDLQIIFRLTWFNSPYDVNREVNNGRGPVDYAISLGKNDKTLVEFKLASNKKLKQNLANQVQVYETANNTKRSIKVIIYFSENEHIRVMWVLKELHLEKNKDIILINACNNKVSASNVKSSE